jgi:biofilm protein TabA
MQGLFMIYDSAENIRNYCSEGDAIFRAVSFVQGFDRERPDGKYEIGTGIFAIVQSVQTRQAKERLFEAHRDYIDVQMVLEGCERQDAALLDNEKFKVSQEYDKEKDIIFFDEPANYSTIIVSGGQFVVYYPTDTHRPCCSVGRPANIRKVCVKIKIR